MLKTRYAKGRIKLKEGEYQRRNNTYEYRWTDKSGKRHSVYARSLEKLRAKEDKIKNDISEEINCCKRDQTINDYFDVWMKIKSGVRESSLITYLRLYKRYMEPKFGSTKLKDLNYSTIVMFYKDLIENHGLGISTTSNINVVLSMILETAIRDDILSRNPCSGALKELKRKYSDTVKEVRALTHAEQEVFEEFLKRPGVFHSLYPLITVMLYTGIRIEKLADYAGKMLILKKRRSISPIRWYLTATVRQRKVYSP